MIFTARLLAPLAVILVFGGCGHVAPAIGAAGSGSTPSTALQRSPNQLVGRVLAVDAARGLAFIDLTAAPPAPAIVDGAPLIARTDDLRETAQLRASRYLRGRTLGANILSGQPAPGDEVVFRPP